MTPTCVSRRAPALLSGLIIAVECAMGQPQATDPGGVARYDGHRLVRVAPRGIAELRSLLAVADDIWSCAQAGAGELDARVSPEQYAALVATGLPHTVLNTNLQAAIDAENARLRAGGASGPDGPWFADFKNLAAISDYVDTLAALRPDLATRLPLGASIEGRTIFGLRIANDSINPGRCRPAVLLNSTQHAREWIAPMVNMYAADKLIRTYDTDPVVRDLVDHVEFLVVPVVNPDGYVYTWTNDRYWRKNRRNNGNGTFGVDTNRNWGFQWGVTLPHVNAGNANPSSSVYWGTAPFSEPETQALRDVVQARPQLRAHADIHSYGQLLLHPWAYSPSPSPGHAVFQAIGLEMRSRILAVHNCAYTAGIWYANLYPSSGAATDWMYGSRAFNSFTIELRGPDFVLPATEIIPNAEEVYPALLYYAQWTLDRYPFNADFNNDCLYTVADFGAFQTGFVAGDPRADFNGDGRLTVADFGAFQNAWIEGR